MSPFRSVGARLSAALGLVVALALAVVYAVAVPALERNLTAAKLDQLERSIALLRPRFPPQNVLVQEFVTVAGDQTSARAVFYVPLSEMPTPLTAYADSRGFDEALPATPTAERAAETGVLQRAVVERQGTHYAEVAAPRAGTHRPRAAPIDETLANVRQVERRLLGAGALALLVALLLGYGAANVFARRIRRLERAADRIADGRLDEPVLVEGRDELGQLAAAFERMRRRLAAFEHARREFIANASHELRTPIFSLGGFLELLGDEDLDEATRREFLATMQEQIERLTRLASDLLDLSRLDAGQLRLDLEPLDLARLAEALRDEFAALAVVEGRELEAAVDGEPAEALGDELRVLQIGRVLVENALRHTEAGTRVAIRVGSSNGTVALAVEDEGPGIAAEHAPHVFERFYRVDGGARASGSGLGLAIARELAEAMDGRIELRSEPGRTVFSLVLPVARRASSSA
ncbi:MAG TPA: ATP-binding protein [Gaiellaceae bacterium]|nr:ATP-binding protein [Gaiellaceae bacterium]